MRLFNIMRLYTGRGLGIALGIWIAFGAQADPILPQVLPSDAGHLDPDNDRYLFDIRQHSLEELHALLRRADQLSQVAPHTASSDKKLNIIMVLHGPDIVWFAKRNRHKNHNIVDLAKRLDAHSILDIRACETSMRAYHVGADELPDFIELVPYGPAEVEKRIKAGYLSL